MTHTETEGAPSTETPVALVKLARTLGVPVEQIGFLADVPAADLAEFRLQVADMLFASQTRRLSRIAAAARVLPAPVIAKLVQLKPNALLAAGTAGLLEPAQAIDVAKRLPARFLAQVAARLDGRRAERIIGKLPTKTVVQVAAEIAKAQDWATLGDLVEVVSDDTARATANSLDGNALVNAARMVDDPAALGRFAALLTEPKIGEMIAAVAEHDRWHDLRPTLRALPEPAAAIARAAADRLPPPLRTRAHSEITTARP